ncbi:MAG: ATPase, partial [Sulfitobacter sp.]|nr:ATPase [Sulfitobacter sp.]
VRSEGGRILLTQVPPLNQPDAMHSSVDDRIEQLLGMD